MLAVHVTTRAGLEQVIEAQANISLMQTLRDAGLDEVLALCGGSCSCATCHVYVEAGPGIVLPPVSPDEDDLLGSSAHRLPTSRLSCQVVMREDFDGLAVIIAPED